jgi:hypothetical protein
MEGKGVFKTGRLSVPSLNALGWAGCGGPRNRRLAWQEQEQWARMETGNQVLFGGGDRSAFDFLSKD